MQFGKETIMYFKHGDAEVIVNVQYSKIGAGYPRIFVRKNGKCINVDLTIGGVFGMSQSDWDSWFDGSLHETESDSEISQGLADIGMNASAFLLALETL